MGTQVVVQQRIAHTLRVIARDRGVTMKALYEHLGMSKQSFFVYVDSGGGTPTPAGITRTDFDHISSALAASDKVGITDLLASGVVVLVDACAPAKLLDTAFGGERQVRIASTGEAVWVDASWLKGASSDCG